MKKERKEKKVYCVGQIVELLMLKPEHGKGIYPIARLDGKICLINKEHNKPFVEYGSTWDCTIDVVNEKFYVVSPMHLKANALDEEIKTIELLRKIKTENQSNSVKVKVKKSFPYLSNQNK